MSETMVPSTKPQPRTWIKEPYFISTDPSLIDIKILNQWFASKDMHWTNPLPEDAMRIALNNSLPFGMYKQPVKDGDSSPEFIGIARCMTDFVSFMYLTDVYVLPAYRGTGVGSWLIGCVKECADEMPHRRSTMLLTSNWARSVPFYERLLGLSVYQGPDRDGEGNPGGLAVLMGKGPGNPSYSSEDAR